METTGYIDRSFYSTLAKIALPLALQNLISFGVGLADNFMVGSLGDRALSGVLISNQVQWVFHMLCAGLSSALVILAAQYIGKGDMKKAKIIIVISTKIAFVSGIFLTAAVFFFPRRIMGLFSEDAAVIAEAMKYIPIVCFSYVFFSLNNMLLASMRCIKNAKIGFYSSITGFVVSVFFNWVLIFGNLGFPALGVAGAAISTLTARILEFTVSFLYMRLTDGVFSFNKKDIRLWDRLLLRDFIKYGMPVILGSAFW